MKTTMMENSLEKDMETDFEVRTVFGRLIYCTKCVSRFRDGKDMKGFLRWGEMDKHGDCQNMIHCVDMYLEVEV